MALSYSPSVVTDGLAFYYDMYNRQKSWKGRPITNQFAIPTPDSNLNVTFQVQGTGTFKRVLSGRYGNYDILPSDIVYRYDLGGLGCHYHGNDVTITSGQTATFSFDYYVDPSVTGYPSTNLLANFEGVLGNSAADPTPTVIGSWKRITFSATAGSTGTCRMLLYPGACSNSTLATGGFILFKNVQVEFDAPGGNPSPFVAGTRSTTQAVLDMTNKNTITATGLTYASDGTFSFNGTSNRLEIPISGSPSLFSMQVAIKNYKAMSAGTNMGPYYSAIGFTANGYTSIGLNLGEWTGSLTNETLSFWHYGATNAAVSIQDTIDANWNIYTINWNGSTYDIWVNGTKRTTSSSFGTMNLITNLTKISVGYNETWAYWFNGSIGAMQIYSKQLTDSEVIQNFSALRGRYGL